MFLTVFSVVVVACAIVLGVLLSRRARSRLATSRLAGVHAHAYRTMARSARQNMDRWSFRPFTGMTAECPKCTAALLRRSRLCLGHRKCIVGVEHFHVQCEGCGHVFLMATADACPGGGKKQ